MNRSNFLFPAFLIFIAVALPCTAAAQSSGRNNPTPLNSSDLRGSLDDHKAEGFYSFVAGPGTLTITVDVKAKREQQGLLNFELLAKNGETRILCCEYAQGNGGGTGRDVKSVKLTRRQTIILHTTNGPIGGGSFHIQLGGPTSFGAGENSNTAAGQSSDRDNPTPLSSGDLRGSLDDHKAEGFYSFVAGPGTLTITVDVKAKREQQGLLNFELLAKNGGTQILCCEYAQGDGGGTGRDVKSVKLTKRQMIILHTTNGPIGGGSFHIQLGGSTSFEGVEKR